MLACEITQGQTQNLKEISILIFFAEINNQLYIIMQFGFAVFLPKAVSFLTVATESSNCCCCLCSF